MPDPKVSFSKIKVDSFQEETMLTGMIMSNDFLRQIRQVYKPELVQSKYAKTVADWCVKYWDKYETNPGSNIESRYNTAVQQGMDDAESDAIARLLEKLNKKVEEGSFDNFNVEHALDITECYFKKRNIELLKENIEVSLEDDDVQRAEQEVASYGKIQRIASESINTYTDKENLRKAFEAREPLYTYPGAYGELINEFLIREGFIAYLGPEKGGKTWNLIDHAQRATANRLNVIYISTGDQNTSELALRQAVNISGRSNVSKYCQEMHVPELDCHKNQDNTCKLRKRECKVGLIDEDTPDEGPVYPAPRNYKPCTKCVEMTGFKPAVFYSPRKAVEPLSCEEAIQYNEWWWRVRMRRKEFKMSFYPEGTVNVDEINTELTNLCYLEDWTPDVIIVDYSDIMKEEPGCKGYSERDKQNTRWMALRRLCQEWHCLLITATQADAASYEQGLLLRKNFSEDKRKYAHSTVTVGLNQVPQEKEEKVNRKNIIMAREGDFNPYRQVTCLECLQMGRPYIDSYWTTEEEKEKLKQNK